VEQYHCIEGEWLSFPVVYHVYRRDPLLRKSEIIACLRSGLIPARYPPRESNGVINEPMNAENFRNLVRRFVLETVHQRLGQPPMPQLRERSSGFIVQHHYMDFDEHFWAGPAIFSSRTFLSTAAPQEVLNEMQRRGRQLWYLDGVSRIEGACYRVRTGDWKALAFPVRPDEL
jgi:hypothetical protein